jgi:hypothetical protein
MTRSLSIAATAAVLFAVAGCGNVGPVQSGGPTFEILVTGKITRAGLPMDSVEVRAVSISCPFEILLCGYWSSETTATNSAGDYQLTDADIGESTCANLSLVITNQRYPESETRWIPLARCGQHTVNEDFPTRLVVTPVTDTLLMGELTQLAATDSLGTPLSDVTWSSTDPAVARVEAATGVATAVRWGTSVITATQGGKVGSARLTVLWGGVSPLPAPVLDSLAGSTLGLSSGNVTHYLRISNRDSYPDELFAADPSLPPCRPGIPASRTRVFVYRDAGPVLAQFCDLRRAGDLEVLQLHLPRSSAPPRVYVTLVDQRTGTVYTSNTIQLRRP